MTGFDEFKRDLIGSSAQHDGKLAQTRTVYGRLEPAQQEQLRTSLKEIIAIEEKLTSAGVHTLFPLIQVVDSAANAHSAPWESFELYPTMLLEILEAWDRGEDAPPSIWD